MTTPSTAIPTSYARDAIPAISSYPGGQTTPSPRAIDFTPGQLLGSVSGELGLRRFLEDARSYADRHDRQGRPRVGLRAGVGRRGRGHFAAVLAGLPDRREDRQGAEVEVGHHRRDRLGPRRPASGLGARDDRGRGDLFQQHQCGGARGDDDPGARAQLHPVLRVGHPGWMEHCRLRGAVVRPRGDVRRIGRRRAHRYRRAAAPQGLRRRSPLHRSPPASGRGGEASWA